MPTIPVRAKIGSRELDLHIEIPGRHFTENTQGYAARVTRYLSQLLPSMGATSWSQGYQTEAARSTADAIRAYRATRSANGERGSLFEPHKRHRRKHRR